MSDQTAVPSRTSSGEMDETSCDQREDEGPDFMDSPARSSTDLHVTQKKSPREFIYSQKPDSYIRAMWPISRNQLWVMCTDNFGSDFALKLFDASGQVLKTVENTAFGLWFSWGMYPIADNMAVALCRNGRTVLLMRDDGSIAIHNIGITLEYLASSAEQCYLYLKASNDSKLSRVTFEFTESPGKPQLTYREVEVVFNEAPPGKLVHVSAGGDYFAFADKDDSNCDRVTVCTKSGMHSFSVLHSLESYIPQQLLLDAQFWRIDGHDRLLLIVNNEDKINVVDYTEGGSLLSHLDTAPINLRRPRRVAIGYDQQAYIGCDGGKVVVVGP